MLKILRWMNNDYEITYSNLSIHDFKLVGACILMALPAVPVWISMF